MRGALYSAGMVIILTSLVRPVFAGTTAVAPEIGADSIVTGLGLLAGGILVVRARWRAK